MTMTRKAEFTNQALKNALGTKGSINNTFITNVAKNMLFRQLIVEKNVAITNGTPV